MIVIRQDHQQDGNDWFRGHNRRGTRMRHGVAMVIYDDCAAVYCMDA